MGLRESENPRAGAASRRDAAQSSHHETLHQGVVVEADPRGTGNPQSVGRAQDEGGRESGGSAVRGTQNGARPVRVGPVKGAPASAAPPLLDGPLMGLSPQVYLPPDPGSAALTPAEAAAMARREAEQGAAHFGRGQFG